MRSSVAILLAAAGFAAAQTVTDSAVSSIATSTTNGCLPGAETIVDACLASTQALADACVGNDWVCLCTQYQNVLTCYNNCPSLPNRATVQNQVTSFCQAAAPLLSASSASAATRSSTASASGSAASTMATSATQAQSTSSSSASASAASASATGAAGGLFVPAGGLVAVALGVFGVL